MSAPQPATPCLTDQVAKNCSAQQWHKCCQTPGNSCQNHSKCTWCNSGWQQRPKTRVNTAIGSWFVAQVVCEPALAQILSWTKSNAPTAFGLSELALILFKHITVLHQWIDHRSTSHSSTELKTRQSYPLRSLFLMSIAMNSLDLRGWIWGWTVQTFYRHRQVRI